MNAVLEIKKTMLFALVACAALQAGNTILAGEVKIVPRNKEYQDKTYEEWSAAWWKWALELPVVSPSGVTHPFIDDPHFDVTEGQQGSVWFLGASFGADRTVTIPANKALFIGSLNVECSTLEAPPFYGGTAEERRSCARSFGDMFIPSTLYFTINGNPVNISAFRATSPDFKFNAPTPWIFGDTGGKGRSTADGYYILIKPLPPGHYDISFGGQFQGPPTMNMTYHITVLPARGGHDGSDDDQQ